MTPKPAARGSDSRQKTVAPVFSKLLRQSLLAVTLCCATWNGAMAQSASEGKAAAQTEQRQQVLLSDAGWQFFGAGPSQTLPEVGSPEFGRLAWETVTVPHVFQTRQHFLDLTQGYYRRKIAVPAAMAGKRIYLCFEGAASIADVYVNGTHLGQHRGAYTRFVFDATQALRAGADNEVVVKVNNDFGDRGKAKLKENADGSLADKEATAETTSETPPPDASDCLPGRDGLYKVWGGLYRKVWLVATDPLHVDPTDDASPGVYITPSNITDSSADLSVKVLLRNTTNSPQDAQVRATVSDAGGRAVATLEGNANCQPDQRSTLELSGKVAQPKLWAPGSPNLYRLRVAVLLNGKEVDAVTQPFGFRTFVFSKDGHVQLNGRAIHLRGANLHQEIETKASAMSDEDFRENYDFMTDLGFNFIRLAHYPRAQFEYDQCDERGIVCWAENGHSEKGDLPGPTANRITTEWVKQNYNHPSIAMWSVGNESGQFLAEQLVPLVKSIDPTRPVVVAQMKCENADFSASNNYPGWYGARQVTDLTEMLKGMWPRKKPGGYISETSAGGVTTTHCDYAKAYRVIDKYEPEEYQHYVAEYRFQTCIGDEPEGLGLFAWWTLRDFTNIKYKGPVGWNTKSLITYGGFKKDIYYLYRCFMRPSEPTLHITSKTYFLRQGAADNGVKVYSNAKAVTLKVNGKTISTLANGEYRPYENYRANNVFYWPVPLRTGKNEVVATDDKGNTDTAILYFYGAGGEPEPPQPDALVTGLRSSNAANPAWFMDMPVQAQWPVYYDFDSTADNSLAELPEVIKDARWIATRRVTKPGQMTDLSFKVTRPATVYVACSQEDSEPAYLVNAGFKKVDAPGFVWRNNNLLLIPAALYARQVKAGELIEIKQPDRNQLILLKKT